MWAVSNKKPGIICVGSLRTTSKVKAGTLGCEYLPWACTAPVPPYYRSNLHTWLMEWVSGFARRGHVLYGQLSETVMDYTYSCY